MIDRHRVVHNNDRFQNVSYSCNLPLPRAVHLALPRAAHLARSRVTTIRKLNAIGCWTNGAKTRFFFSFFSFRFFLSFPYSLRAAAISGHDSMVEKLLDCNADPNVGRTSDNGTALMGSAIAGDLTSTNLLLAAHADPNMSVAVPLLYWPLRPFLHQPACGPPPSTVACLGVVQVPSQSHGCSDGSWLAEFSINALVPTPSTHTRALPHTHTHARTHTRTHTHMHTRAHAHTRTHAHTHTRTHTCTHAHTHTHTHTLSLLSYTLFVSASLRTRNNNGSALMIASRRGHNDVVAALLKAGANVNRRRVLSVPEQQPSTGNSAAYSPFSPLSMLARGHRWRLSRRKKLPGLVTTPSVHLC